MRNERTCGRGLAEHAVVPAKAAEVIAALALNLEAHLKTLDLSDPSSRREHDAYRTLAAEYAEIASRLAATAQRMAGYRDLPMGRHDAATLASPSLFRTFEELVALERELLDRLGKRFKRDRDLLAGLAAVARTAAHAPVGAPVAEPA